MEATGCDGRPAVRTAKLRILLRSRNAIYQAAAVAYDRRYRRGSTEDRPLFALTAPIGLSEARRLAHVLDSLVRVSRRDGQSTDTVHRDPRVGGLRDRRPSKSSTPGESPIEPGTGPPSTRGAGGEGNRFLITWKPGGGTPRQRPACDTYFGQDVGPGARRTWKRQRCDPSESQGQFDLRLSARL